MDIPIMVDHADCHGSGVVFYCQSHRIKVDAKILGHALLREDRKLPCGCSYIQLYPERCRCSDGKIKRIVKLEDVAKNAGIPPAALETAFQKAPMREDPWG